MSVVTDELKDDAKWLRELADDPTGVGPTRERLNRIADDLGNYASLMHSTSLLLEQRAEEAMDKHIRKILDGNTPDPLALSLWLIVRALRNGASKALLGQGLASLGAGAFGSFIGNVMDKSVAPLDPDDPAEADAVAFMRGKGVAPLDPDDKG